MRNRFFRRPRLLVAVLAAGATVFAGAPAAHAQSTAATLCPGADVVADAATLGQVRGAMHCLINEVRTRSGLAAVRPQPQLQQAAVGHATDMVAHGYFSHADRDGGHAAARAIRAGYVRTGGKWVVGENLGSSANATAERIMEAWLNSTTHRAVLLKPDFRDVGVAVVLGSPLATPDGAPAATVVAEFGRRTSKKSFRSRSRR